MNSRQWSFPASLRTAGLIGCLVFVVLLLFRWLVVPVFPFLGEFPARIVAAGVVAGLIAWLVIRRSAGSSDSPGTIRR